MQKIFKNTTQREIEDSVLEKALNYTADLDIKKIGKKKCYMAVSLNTELLLLRGEAPCDIKL